jgi:hypothetical protein
MIKEAQRSNYTEPTVHSHNKVKTWNNTKPETRKKVNNDDNYLLKVIKLITVKSILNHLIIIL